MLRVFKELAIRGTPENLSSFVAQISKDPLDHWVRDRGREPSGRGKVGPGFGTYAFRWTGSPELPALVLFLVGRGDTLKTTNVVPIDVPKLSREQYNAAVDHFVETCVTPFARLNTLSLNIGNDRYDITHWLSDAAARKLITFSHNANRWM